MLDAVSTGDMFEVRQECCRQMSLKRQEMDQDPFVKELSISSGKPWEDFKWVTHTICFRGISTGNVVNT